MKAAPDPLDFELRMLMRTPFRSLPHEPRAATLLTPAQLEVWLGRRCRLRERWPRVCRACGGEFRYPCENVVRCERCRRRARRNNGGRAG